MGAISGLLGTAGGANGSGFAAPSSVATLNPTTVDQANQSYQNALQGLGNQAQFVNALQNNAGVDNQANVYNQLQGVVNGTGPNPATAQLAQATGANTANQAALMAGQRGSSSNVGLMARQAAMQGANNQQQAIGQAATTQANQSLNALNSAGTIAGNQVNQAQQGFQGYNTAAQGLQSNVLGGIAAQNNANVGMQSNLNTANAGLAESMEKGQAGMLGGPGATMSLAQGGKIRQQYAAGTTNASNSNAPDAYAPQQPMQAPPMQQAPAIQPMAAPAAQAASMAAGPQSSIGRFMANYSNSVNSGGNSGAQGPNLPKLAMQIYKKFSSPSTPATPTPGNPYDQYSGSGFSPDQMSLEKSRTDMQNEGGLPPDGADPAAAQGATDTGAGAADAAGAGEGATDAGLQAAAADTAGMEAAGTAAAGAADAGGLGLLAALNKGGKVPAMVSPGERYLPPSEVAAVKEGKKNPMEAGEKIPGKPKVGGAKNSYANDTVPKDLEEGGLVLPRSVTQSKHPHWAAMKFVQAHMAQGGKVLPTKPKAKK